MSRFDKIRDAIADTLNVPADNLTETTAASDLPAWDSLGHINLMMAIEAAFDTMLDPEEMNDLTSVPKILAYLDANDLD